ncbi:hypothetical protein F511_18150 [Dorcoceras hygrometricum]|uniref:Uncharacterized protein n=1 Tax=Dorcoceras hygrometricum TaxID=472368 RepID=A0A2Z7BFC8_9LAMI|nr:hypothetical protein F511_18150 [Dorcoceras hygrometricum]
MQHHLDYGFLPKTQPDLNPAVHVSLYRRSKYNIMRIFVSFRIVDFTLGPDLRTEQLTQSPAYDTKIGKSPEGSPQDRDSPEASLPSREYLPRTLSRRDEESCPSKRIPRIVEDIRQNILFHRLSPSINTRHRGEAQSSPQLPDATEILDVIVFARRLR